MNWSCRWSSSVAVLNFLQSVSRSVRAGSFETAFLCFPPSVSRYVADGLVRVGLSAWTYFFTCAVFLFNWTTSVDLLVKLLPFLPTTSYGSGANGVDSLFCFSCFSTTLLPGTRSEYSACLFLSAYNLAFTFISPSLSCTSLTTRSSWNSGNLVRIFLPNRSSAGLTPVVVWGVDLYAIKYLRTSFFLCFPLACTICNLFKRVGSAFPLRHLLGAIMIWFSCVWYHSIPSIFQTAHCQWLLIVVNHESWKLSPDSYWSPQMLWNTWSQFHNICWSSQPQLTQSHLTVKDPINPWPSLVMDLVLRGLTWLAHGGEDCLLAGIPDAFCKILLSLCQSRATILLITTSASY